jgi:hypothetical protein
MQKPENITACRVGAGIHLFRTAALAAPDNSITEANRESFSAVSAHAVDDNNFGATGSFAQLREKPAYQPRLVKDRNNNRDLH